MAVDLPDEGSVAPPRSNGELVFAAPWESRVFGLAVAMANAGIFEWEEFQRSLIEEISRWEKEDSSSEWHYYRRWQQALENLLASKGIVAGASLGDRSAAIAHHHDHEHDH